MTYPLLILAILVGLLMMSLSTLVVLFVFLLCFMSGVAVA